MHPFRISTLGLECIRATPFYSFREARCSKTRIALRSNKESDANALPGTLAPSSLESRPSLRVEESLCGKGTYRARLAAIKKNHHVRTPIPPGTRLGRYEVKSQLGAGGMGEVYLALDSELGRTIAIKILPEELASDEHRLRRFVQEARAASALNHPHILTIYEIGGKGSSRFIATEFIDGDTLRKHIGAGMKLAEILEIAIQAGSALAAAHAAGIIHRDIKPENIMVRRDGYIKLLDFGLAKLTEPEGSLTDREAPTRPIDITRAGTLVGTVNYMSPEQAKGIDVDARTDLWSLGAVVYEMITGHLPFGGETQSETISLILLKDPPPLTRYTNEVPAELERIVSKALTKNREERYQTAKDVLIDLRHLKRMLDRDAEIDRAAPPEFRAGTSTSAGSSTPGTSFVTAASTSLAGIAPPASTAEYIKKHKLGAAIALVGVLIGGMGLSYYLRTRKADVAIESIAVLPFGNTSSDANTEYLSDGVAETLINSLSRFQQLRVVARSTAFRYKGKEIDPQAVGRDLNVRAVLMGRVRQIGDSLNIQVDLIDVTTGAQIWGQDYDRKVSDVLAVKQDIAREVTNKLRLSLTGEQQKQLTSLDATNTEAYQSYLKGRYYWNKRTVEGIRKAIEQFQQATDRDPNYALAYVGLADCYLGLEGYAGTPASETYPKAKAYAERALQLDSSSAEAHASLGIINDFLWQWDEAEREYKRAIDLNPNYPSAHQWYGLHFNFLSQFDKEMVEIKRAQQLDPLSLAISANLEELYLNIGDLTSALEQCRRTIQLDPYWPEGHKDLGWVYLAQGRYVEAIAEFQKAVELTRRTSGLGSLGVGYALAGKRAEALAILKELEEQYANHKALGRNIAVVHANLGNKDQAFAWLEKDFQAHSGVLPSINVGHDFDALRSDQRFNDLLRRMGLTP
jgi:serine/threonine protein kinase/TolB-like protein/Tfp pilus assembly protein PilF